ncbi:MAG: tetratricopeptide repeat protein [Spirochaetaceae bacterium]|jgi:tetratricopeptide (TPR) repeat protein|nr:tetratricopeptide repeat protein [Spirochaetaceae bacterium]
MRGPLVLVSAGCGLWTPAFQSTLTKAAGLARRGKYEAASQLLESEVYNYRDSFMFFYLLGLCCLYSGNYGVAHDYLTRAHELKRREPSALLALAALYVKRADSRRAISLYLEVQDIDGKNRTAKRALNILKKYAGSDDLQAWIEKGKLRSLYPRFPRAKVKPSKVIRNIVFCAAFLTLAAVAFSKRHEFAALYAKPSRAGFAETTLTAAERQDPAMLGGVYSFILTEKQILSAYENARRYFNEHRDNAAMVEINRITGSNANEGIKNKARLMENYIEAPGFETLRRKPSDNIKYADAVKAPLLYRNCYVLWRGAAANIIVGQAETTFDFLIGYDKRTDVEGIVRVRLPFAANIDTGRPLEVLGKIVPLYTPEVIGLEGITVHQPVN